MAPPETFPDTPPDDHARRLSDPERLAALERTGLMDSLAEEAFDRAVRLATAALGTPVGLMALVDGQRQFFKAQTGLPAAAAAAGQTPVSHSFCQYVVTEDTALAVTDARDHPLLRDNGAVPDLGVVAYLGVPIHAPDGQPLGSFCVIDSAPHAWTDREKSVLEDLAAMIESELRLRDEAARRQLLVGELNHRVKNLFAVVSGMIGITARASDTPAEMAESLRGRIHALARAHDLIRPAVTQEDMGPRDVSMLALVSALVDPHVRRHDESLGISGPDLTLGADAATNLALIIGEFATNAAKYGALSVPDGALSVTWTVDNDTLRIDWHETGAPEITGTPETRGFGSHLVDMTLRGHFTGEMETDWHVGGVRRRLSLPRSRL